MKKAGCFENVEDVERVLETCEARPRERRHGRKVSMRAT
jgi:hypothetical protein